VAFNTPGKQFPALPKLHYQLVCISFVWMAIRIKSL